MKDVKREYSNGEITVVWDSKKCIHSGNCVRGLPAVFNPKERPWIKIEAADSESVGHQVDQCPTGAISWYRNDGMDGKVR